MIRFKWSKEAHMEVSTMSLDSFLEHFATVAKVAEEVKMLPEIYVLRGGMKVVIHSRKKTTPWNLERFQGNGQLYFTQAYSV